MRLGQLARQLSVSPDELVTFLGTREVAVDSNHNTRLESTQVDLILHHFAAGNEELRQQVQEQLPEPSDAVDADLPVESPPETIRAPKVELQGLRVVGKIDLPEKKKPEPKEEEPVHAP